MRGADQTTLSALSDFFLARTGSDLATAFAILAGDNASTNDTEDPEGIDWEAAEFVFNKLFVGPMAPQAPPYASCYLSAEPQLMGECTLKVRRLYEMTGLTSPLQGRIPDDHLGVELDAARLMLSMIAQFNMEEPRALWRFFLKEHLNTWVPQFLDRARKAESAHPAIDLALNKLEAWLNDQQRQPEGYVQ